MTRRERLLAIYRGDVPDRPAVRLWRAMPDQELLHPAYETVHRAAMKHTDLVVDFCTPFNLYCGVHDEQTLRRHEVLTASPEWVDEVTTVTTPRGPLRSIFRKSTQKKPGYEVEHLVKEPEDIRRLLALPYAPYPFHADAYLQMEAALGDAGILMFNLDHAMYGLQRLIGSENFALWSIACPDLLLEAIEIFAGRIRALVQQALDTGLRSVFGWVGPELCMPPLMPPAAFESFVYAVDKPLVDRIHDAGGSVWVHCHGKMRPVLDRFADMGVDVLNPVEPPPMGDVTLEEAFALVGDRMGLEGNIQGHDLMTASRKALTETIHAAVRAGAGHRHILCICSSYMEDPEPSERLIENLLCFVHEGVRAAEAQGKAG